jgi:hypothetical protein
LQCGVRIDNFNHYGIGATVGIAIARDDGDCMFARFDLIANVVFRVAIAAHGKGGLEFRADLGAVQKEINLTDSARRFRNDTVGQFGFGRFEFGIILERRHDGAGLARTSLDQVQSGNRTDGLSIDNI